MRKTLKYQLLVLSLLLIASLALLIRFGTLEGSSRQVCQPQPMRPQGGPQEQPVQDPERSQSSSRPQERERDASLRAVRDSADEEAVRSLTGLMLEEAETLREVVSTSTEPNEVHAAVWAMGNRMELSDEDVAVLLQRLESASPQEVGVLKAILWALSLRPDRLPIEQLAVLAQTHVSAEVRRAALRTLGTLSDPRAVRAVESVARHDSEPQNRQEGVFFLTLHVASAESAALAQEALASETDPVVRAHWLNLAGAHGTEAGKALLEEKLHSSGEAIEVRTMAAEMLAGQDRAIAEELAGDSSLPQEIRDHVRLVCLEPKTACQEDLP